MTAVSLRRPSPAVLVVPALVAAALALALANAQTYGGLDAVRLVLEQGSAAPVRAVELVYGWLPRVVVALVAGAGLAAAGTVMQQVLRNPIASPLTLGVAAGSQLALSGVTLLAPGMLSLLAEPAAMAGGAAALALVLGLSWHRRLDPTTVVLAGLVVSLYIGALNAGLLLFFQYDLSSLLIWGSGVLTQHDWSDAAFLLPRLAAALALLALLRRPLGVMTLDDASAHGLGLGLQRARLLCLAVGVYITACVVSAVGIVGFVGLAAPALARTLGARTVGQRLLLAPPLGGTLLLLADQIVVGLDPILPGLLPTGALTALVGAPLLLVLLRQLRVGAPSGGMSASAAAGAGRAPRLSSVWLIAALLVLLAVTVGRDAGGWTLDGPFAVLAGEPWRLPRVAAAACAGLLLGLAGALLQRLLRNPMASPEVLGISGGALIGVVATLYLVPTAGQLGLVGAGTLGAFAVVTGLLLFAHRAGGAPERLLLVGIALKALFDATLGVVAVSGTPFWQRLLNWVSGSTYLADWTTVGAALAAVALVLPLALLLHRWVDLLGLGGEQAAARGLHVAGARQALLGLAALATAAATLLVGPLSFVGLMAPHLAYILGFRSSRAQLAGACGIGVALMVGADWLGRTVAVPYEVPGGLVASFVGGLYFMWLLRRL